MKPDVMDGNIRYGGRTSHPEAVVKIMQISAVSKVIGSTKIPLSKMCGKRDNAKIPC